MKKIIAIDIDGILIRNRFSKLFGDGDWMSKLPFIKKCSLRTFELLEWLTKSKIRHETNQPLIDLLNSLKENMIGVSIFLLTDRSWLGFENIYKEISSLLLNSEDSIQILTWRKESQKQRDKIRKIVGPEIKIFFSYYTKPHKSVLYSLAAFAVRKRIKPSEVLVVDNNPQFLRVAKTFFGFNTLPEVFSDGASDKIKAGRAADIISYLVQQAIGRV